MNTTTPYTPVVSIIGFHHARGPEVEHWIGVDDQDHISEWPLLPFLALADGAHFAEEDFSYFTLKHETASGPTTLFGISCTRQLDSNELIDRPADVTRSTVQKAVVVIANSPTFFFGHLKQQLSAVTTAWFAQRNFEDLDIITKFQESLKKAFKDIEHGREQYVGLSLRELVYEFRHQTLVLFKCALLQPKMLFFGSRCERLCMTQFSLLSLVPGLLRNLEDCSDPDLNSYESKLRKPTSVKTSDRQSLLKFMGFPLQIFGKGALFGPYTPLQQLDILADFGTKSYIVGSTNSLLLQQRDRYSDILVNLDENSINVTSPSLRAALVLSAADRRWIDALVFSVTESWDEADPSRPKTMGFVGSEDYIRLQFEEYVLSMVSSVKYHLFLDKHHGSDQNLFLPDIEGDPAYDFQMDWVDYWKMTENFRIFQKFTDSELFDLVPPKHVMAGGLTMEDVQRRIVQQMRELGVDEKVNRGREVLATTLASGRTNVTTVFSNLSKNVEKFREQRRSQDVTPQPNSEVITSPTSEGLPATESAAASTATTSIATPAIPVAETVTRAGTYFSSWAAWAGEKKKAFVKPSITSPPPEPATDANEKSLPPDPPKKSFEESIFDARARAAYGGSDSPIMSPQRNSGSGFPLGAAKNLDDEKGVGLGIANLEPKNSPVPTTERPLPPKLDKVLPIDEERRSMPPPTPAKQVLAEEERAKTDMPSVTPAKSTLPIEEEGGERGIPSPTPAKAVEEEEQGMSPPTSMEKAPLCEREQIETGMHLAAPVGSGLSVEEEKTEKVMPPPEPVKSVLPIEEEDIPPPTPVKDEPKTVFPGVQEEVIQASPDTESSHNPGLPVEKPVESPVLDPESIESTQLLASALEVEIPTKAETDTAQPLASPVEKVESPKLVVRKRRVVVEPTQPSSPVLEKVERPLRPGRLAQTPFGPTIGVTSEISSVAEKIARRSIPTFETAIGSIKSEVSPEPMKSPDYNKASPMEAISARAKSPESFRVGRHIRGESVTHTSPQETIIKPLSRAGTESATIGLKTSGESLRSTRFMRSESPVTITGEPVLKPTRHTRNDSGSLSPVREPALRPIRHARTESGSMNSDNSVLRSVGHVRVESGSTGLDREPILRPIRHARTESGSMNSDKDSVLRSVGHTRTDSGRMSPEKDSSLRSIGHIRSESGSTSPEKPALKPERIKSSIAERAKRFSQQEDPDAPKSSFAARRAMFEKK
ncbi:uncharacterized protein LAJ45_00324 [Morchella importuna]|uniref:uncharacterized protein n=1 Tax=Morchella importuna TaxID=1174673 RepID=UPI001E8E218C|nr:uncharacterized protein LAJ45_00324 [Morchella importuna]KAH8155314.1 hypothetical protein LAJ45_00324 [Morchella importuna]